MKNQKTKIEVSEKIERYNKFIKSVKYNLNLVAEWLESIKGNIQFTDTGALQPFDKKTLLLKAKYNFNPNFDKTEIEVSKKLSKYQSRNQYWVVLKFTRQFSDGTELKKSIQILYRDSDSNNYLTVEKLEKIVSGFRYQIVESDDVVDTDDKLAGLKRKQIELKKQLEQIENSIEKTYWVREEFLDIEELDEE